LSDYFVYMVPFPDGIREAVTPGYENDYTIYINEKLPDEEKLKRNKKRPPSLAH